MGKIFFIVFSCLLFVGFIGFAYSAQAVTLRDFLDQPLPDVGLFMARVLSWLRWLLAKILQFVNLILDWTLDNILAYLWKILIWAWNFIVESFRAGWRAFLYIWSLIVNNSIVDFESIRWPWE